MDRKQTFARQALEALEEARSQVGRLRRTVKTLRSRCTNTVRGCERVSTSRSDVHQELWDALADQQTLLEQKERQLRELEEKLEQWIDLLPKPRWRMVLRCHYIDAMPLSEVALELTQTTGREFTKDQIYRFHRNALNAADRIWPTAKH